MRGVTRAAVKGFYRGCISTHTPHARRDYFDRVFHTHEVISTHTPHARRDQRRYVKVLLNIISTHTPHARRDKDISQTTI